MFIWTITRITIWYDEDKKTHEKTVTDFMNWSTPVGASDYYTSKEEAIKDCEKVACKVFADVDKVYHRFREKTVYEKTEKYIILRSPREFKYYTSVTEDRFFIQKFEI